VIPLPLGQDDLVGGGEFFVLCPQLRLGGVQLLQGDIELFLGLVGGGHGASW
jgi:hypothetical protein